MELKERMEMYEAGASISEIARVAGVSRTAVRKYLKRVGVHGGGTPVQSDVGVEPKGGTRLDCPIDAIPDIDLSSLGTAQRRVGRNLYASSRGFVVKYWGDDGVVEERYDNAEDLAFAYDIC